MKCSECTDLFETESDDSEEVIGYFCWAEGYATRDIEDTNTRPEWCPLEGTK